MVLQHEDTLIYLGQHNVYDNLNYASFSSVTPSKQHVFLDIESKRYIHKADVDFISNVIDETPVPNFAELVQKLVSLNQVGQIQSISEFNTSIPFKHNGRYSSDSYDYTVTKGEDYIGYRGDDSLITKFGNTMFIPLGDNTYQVVNVFREREKIPSEDNYKNTYYLNWKLKGFGLTSSRIVTIQNNEVVIKSAKNPYKDKLFTVQELNTMTFKILKVVLKNGVSVPLINSKYDLKND